MNRTTYLMLCGALDFSFGMTWQDHQSEWDKGGVARDLMERHGGIEPRLMSSYAKRAWNARARRERRLAHALLTMSDHDFALWSKTFNPMLV